MKKLGFFFILTGLFFSANLYSRTFTIAVEPTYTNDQLEQMLKPLSQWLKAKTGHDLELVPAENYYLYWKDTVLEQPDLTLDPPHIAAYRIQQNHYKPLIRMAEPTYYHLVVDAAAFEGDNHVKDTLRGKKISTLQHPSMASILYEQWYDDSVIMPQKVLARRSFQDGVDLIFDQQADATIIPEKLLSLYPNFVSVQKSEPFLGLTLSVAPHIQTNSAYALQQVLLEMHNDPDAYEALVEWNTSHFVEAQEAEYVDMVSLIPSNYMEAAKEILASK